MAVPTGGGPGGSWRRLLPLAGNAFWLMLERVVALALAFAVTVAVARHLGPADYGVLAYALALTGLLAIAGHLGLGGLLVRELVRAPAHAGAVLGTVLVLKTAGYALALAGLLAVSAVLDGPGTPEFMAVAVLAGALLLRGSETFEAWFHAQVRARTPSLVRLGGHVGAAALKLALVAGGSGVLAFALAGALQGVLVALGLALVFFARGAGAPRRLVFEAPRARALLSQGSLVFLGSVFAMVYLRIDQVMLRQLTDTDTVGVYAVAAQLSEAWYFVAVAIVTSVFPGLIRLHEQDPAAFARRFQQLLSLLLLLAVVVALPVSLLARPLVVLLFGEPYAASAPILALHVWGAVFVFMRTAFSRWILLEDLLLLSVITQGSGALLNVLLNLWLIPLYGGVGAALATVTAHAVAGYLTLGLHPRARPVFVMMTRAFLGAGLLGRRRPPAA